MRAFAFPILRARTARAVLVAGAIWIGGSDTSFACENPDNIHGIIYDALPPDTEPSAIVLDVEFERAALDGWRGGIIEARVRRVVQGEFDGERVRIGLITASCLWPFIFGAEGLIIGRMRKGFEGGTMEARAYPSGERTTLDWRLGFEGVWFQPRSESIRERRERQ